MTVFNASGDPPAPSWPAATLPEIETKLCAPGARFEMERVEVLGVSTRSWKNQPANLAALAHFARTEHRDRLFMIYEDERVTYDGAFRAAVTLAAEFNRLGVQKGDRVALAMRNLPEWPIVFFAAVSLGMIIVPLNGWWTGAELSYGLKNSETKLLVCDEARWDRIEPYLSDLPDLEHVLISRASGWISAPVRRLEDVIGDCNGYGDLPDYSLPEVEVAPDDDATIFYTSGTTGLPKGALGTHRNMLTNVFAGAYVAERAMLRRGETPGEPITHTILLVIPLFHVTACNATLIPTVAAGNTLVFMSKWDTLRAFELIEREKVTITGGVPTIAWQLIEHPDRHKYDLRSLQSIAYGGAPSAPELVRLIHSELGASPGNGWGMTETSATVTSHNAEDYLHRPDSCGPPLPVSDLRIMSLDGERELPVGEVGELWASGPQIVKGYWNNPQATDAAFAKGWVRTGDLARLDAEGFCYIVDRAKDIVIRGGENIYSSEVENVLYEHPAVTDAAVIGIAHRTLGEEPAAVVHLSPGRQACEAELQDWVRARLAEFKTPVRFLFVEETLPRNANGKILKKDLKVLFQPASRGSDD